MIQLIQAIALLCQVSSGAGRVNLHQKMQLQCHKYYVKCTEGSYVFLPKCIMEREI